MDLGLVIRGIAPVIREYVANEIRSVADRLTAVERREPVPGRDGRDGLPGAIGEKGLTGDRGLPGEPGPVGPLGPIGPIGEKGLTGERGEQGQVGEQGPAGKDADDTVIAELRAELTALRAEMATGIQEAKALATEGARAIHGKSLTPDDVRPVIVEEISRAVAALPVPKDGQDGPPGASVETAIVEAMVASTVERAVAAIRVPQDGQNGQDGQSVTVADVQPLIQAEVAKAVALLPVPKDGLPGASVDPVAVEAMVARHVEVAVSALPAPKDGRSLTVEDVAPFIAAEVQRSVAALPVPKDGVGVTSAFVTRDGNIVLTLSDGGTKDIGRVVPDPSDVSRILSDLFAAMPKPKDGAPGRDGTLENLKAVYDGERTVTLCHKNGDPIEGGVMRLPIVLDRGVYKQGTAYLKGDGVTFGGSFWIAQDDTSAKPDEPTPESRSWRLAIKRGGEGKPGPKGEKGIDGKDGRDGKDLTQMGHDGRKW